MTSEVVNLEVTASIPIDCDFWSEDDGWKGKCKSLPVTVRGSSFEDAKKNQVNYRCISKEPCVSILREGRGESPEINIPACTPMSAHKFVSVQSLDAPPSGRDA